MDFKNVQEDFQARHQLYIILLYFVPFLFSDFDIKQPPDYSTMVSKITVLISGNGTNLQALIDACQSGALSDATINHVISNRKNAFGLQRATDAGIPTTYHNLLKYKKEYPGEDQIKSREVYDAALADIVLAQKPHLVVCAGWLHILAPTFLNPLASAGVKIINLHPALPRQFNGLNAVERAFEAFQRKEITKTGLMIHYVISEVDMGQPIVVKEVEIKEGDTLQELEQRIHHIEWEAIVEGTRIVLESLRPTKDH